MTGSLRRAPNVFQGHVRVSFKCEIRVLLPSDNRIDIRAQNVKVNLRYGFGSGELETVLRMLI
jgi:hypothetical protein